MTPVRISFFFQLFKEWPFYWDKVSQNFKNITCHFIRSETIVIRLLCYFWSVLLSRFSMVAYFSVIAWCSTYDHYPFNFNWHNLKYKRKINIILSLQLSDLKCWKIGSFNATIFIEMNVHVKKIIFPLPFKTYTEL